jgi:HSP20 family molecular chaperone IbpA
MIYRPQPSIPDIFDEIFAPLVGATCSNTPNQGSYTGEVSADGSVYTFVVEIPRLVRDTIAVDVEKMPTSDYYKVKIKAGQELLSNYLQPTQESAKKAYEQHFTLKRSDIALDGDLGLSYTEGVLCIQIPLTKPTQPKKQALSAKLSDIDALA